MVQKIKQGNNIYMHTLKDLYTKFKDKKIVTSSGIQFTVEKVLKHKNNSHVLIGGSSMANVNNCTIVDNP
jgi:hypothetical protein